ncbi:hypothetical protein QQS21_000099 [Conoideocrella luteorostrata]|uniref:Peptidase M14 domain-containing protein n=1 Tax=Conoideocrella luteorostrata TaxID=1105319 RepID=A0AAJ0CZL1_9HYPO|nr:hypothetical protein QQS21_000099 [Conoideocrella luteorostrata]
MRLSFTIPAITFGFAVSACLLPGDFEEDKATVHDKRQSINFLAIGKENRFKDGTVPQGMGSNPGLFKNEDKLAILNINEIGSAVESLQKAYPDKLKLDTKTEPSVEKRPIYLGVIGSAKPRVFFTGGVHARERGGPDNIIYFLSDLLWADKHNTGLTYENQSYTVSDVRAALGVGIAFIPAVNPDGIDHDQKTDSCWRKNRRSFGNGKFGVDINRNFNIFRDFKRVFSPKAKYSMSLDAGSQTYIGPEPLSEPETRNIANVFKTTTSLSWYLDLHSALGKILYSWGDDFAQTEDKLMNYTNPTWDGKRGVLNTEDKSDEYKEYMEPDDFEAQKAVSERMVKAMNGVGNGSFYQAAETIELYPSQATTDEAMAKYYDRTCGANRINALTFEFGETKSLRGDCKAIMYPDAKKYRQNVLHTSVGLMEFMLNAAARDDTKIYNKKDCVKDGKSDKSGQSQPQTQNWVTKCLKVLSTVYHECKAPDCQKDIRRDAPKTCTKQQPQPKRACMERFRPFFTHCGQSQACQEQFSKRAGDACEQVPSQQQQNQSPSQTTTQQQPPPTIKPQPGCIRKKNAATEQCKQAQKKSQADCDKEGFDLYNTCQACVGPLLPTFKGCGEAAECRGRVLQDIKNKCQIS